MLITCMWYSIALHYNRIKIIIVVGKYTSNINNIHVVQYRLTRG